MLILSIETSCDDTAVALVEARRDKFIVRDEYVSSQIKTHAPFGGVVPDLAARNHLKNLPVLLERIIEKNKIAAKNVDLIAVTQGPGLIPALLIGTNAAKALAYAWKKPLVGVHHIAGHIYANFITNCHCEDPALAGDEVIPQKTGSPRSLRSLAMTKNIFPILALIVSGGHTELILMRRHLDYKIIGQTLDDAAGEAFDKAAKILGLGYPGGPIISKIADEFQNLAKARLFPPESRALGFPQSRAFSNFSLPRPMINSGNLDFSFSGLKTALLYTVRDHPQILKSKKMTAEICAEFQQAVVDVLVRKTLHAARKYNPKTVLLGGGVSANKELRKQLGKTIKNNFKNTLYVIPDTLYSLDNAAMIAVAGYFRWKLSKNRKPFYNNWRNLEADANLKL